MSNNLTTTSTQGSVVLPVLTSAQLDIVRELAQEGNREHTIRRALRLSPTEWKKHKEAQETGEISPLALALEEGRAEGAGEIVAFMKNKMKLEGDIRAAEWLANRIYKINKGDGNSEDAPRVLIQINAALTPEDYGKVIHVESR